MFDLDLSKLAVVGVVALIVVGPEKLPRLARTVGALIGKAQRYVSDVKAEVNRSIELEELQKMKAQMERAAQEVESSVQTNISELEHDWVSGASNTGSTTTDDQNIDDATFNPLSSAWQVSSTYRSKKKNWRIKQSAMPQWFKARSGIRRQALSGAARVARHRPKARAA